LKLKIHTETLEHKQENLETKLVKNTKELHDMGINHQIIETKLQTIDQKIDENIKGIKEISENTNNEIQKIGATFHIMQQNIADLYDLSKKGCICFEIL